MATLINDATRAEHLPALGDAGWSAVPGRDAIRKVWKFRDFSESWGFMARVALAAQAMDHHPEWRNTYNVVDITLTTHDCHGLSALDIDLARQIDAIAGDAPVQRDLTAPIQSLCQMRAAR